ncbi:MAG: hypothetical protein IT331_19035 [Anaerolineae bacterium]|nr:hypothetical protein [Anaerolineae bacterium]
MAKKAAWILVVLVALMAISASVAFAASMTRPAQASLAPVQELSADGRTSFATVRGLSGGMYKHAGAKAGGSHCHLESDAPAY